MKMDLVAWWENFGMACMPCIVLPIQDSASYRLTICLLMVILYDNFRVWSAAEKYKLSVSGLHGVTSDPSSGEQSPNGMTMTSGKEIVQYIPMTVLVEDDSTG